MISHEALSLQRRTLLTGLAALGTSAIIGGNEVMAAIAAIGCIGALVLLNARQAR